MRILSSIVLPPTALMAALDSEIAGRGAVRPQVIRDQSIGNEAVFLQKFSHQFQRGMPVSLGLNQHIKYLSFGVDGAPQIDHAASGFQIDFVQMPCRVGLGATLAQFRRDHRPKVVHPAPDCLV
jgi:hypothetical protein